MCSVDCRIWCWVQWCTGSLLMGAFPFPWTSPQLLLHSPHATTTYPTSQYRSLSSLGLVECYQPSAQVGPKVCDIVTSRHTDAHQAYSSSPPIRLGPVAAHNYTVMALRAPPTSPESPIPSRGLPGAWLVVIRVLVGCWCSRLSG